MYKSVLVTLYKKFHSKIRREKPRHPPFDATNLSQWWLAWRQESRGFIRWPLLINTLSREHKTHYLWKRCIVLLWIPSHAVSCFPNVRFRLEVICSRPLFLDPFSPPSLPLEESIWIMAKQIDVIKIPLMTSVAMEVIHPLFFFSWFCFTQSALDQRFCKCLPQTRAHRVSGLHDEGVGSVVASSYTLGI